MIEMLKLNSVLHKHKFLRNICLFIFLSASSISYSQSFETQRVPAIIENVYALIEDEKYEDGYELLQNIEESQTVEYGDSCAMMYNYEMGSCLYFLDRYEEAIPYLSKALLKMEKLPHEDCIYLELIYGIGSCYNKLQQYHNAEKFFRRVIIRGNSLAFECKITAQTLSELADVYNQLGYTKLAKECSRKINERINHLPSKSWEYELDLLLDLATSYEKQSKFDEEIGTYHKILKLIDAKEGKENEHYLTYSSILYHRLLLIDKTEEAISILIEMISIGKSMEKQQPDICYAYQNYLEIMAKQNNMEVVEAMIPEAVEYIQHTDDYNWHNYNLYERIGNAFFEAGNDSCGRYYLEMPWNNKQQYSIRALGNLGSYYYDINPQKSLSFFKEAESRINDSIGIVTKKVIYSHIHTLSSKLKRYNEAVKYAELAAPYIKEIDGNDIYVRHLTIWAIDCYNANYLDEARMLFEEIKSYYPNMSDNTKVAYNSQYGYFLIKTNESGKAVDILKEGIKLCKDTFGENYALLTTMYHNLGRAYMLQQDYANALLFFNTSKTLQIKLNGNAMQRTLDYIKECETK